MSADELFQTYDASGNPGPLVPRGRVHAEGLWHRAVNVFVFRTSGAVVLQRRAASKDVCPGLWDLSVAEHLQPGEDYPTAARRGLHEELGLTVEGLAPIGAEQRVHLELPELGIRDYELHQCFAAISDAAIVMDPQEVAATADEEWLTLRARMRSAPQTFTPWLHTLAEAVEPFVRRSFGTHG